MTCQSQYWFPDPSKTLWECAETWLGEQTESSSYSVSDTQWFFCNYLPSPLICWIAWQCSVVDGFRNGCQHGCAGSYLRHDNHDSHDGCLALCPGVHHETDAQQPERLSVDLGVSGCVASHGSTVLPRIPSQVDTLHLHSVSRSVSVEVPTRNSRTRLTFYLFVHLSS